MTDKYETTQGLQHKVEILQANKEQYESTLALRDSMVEGLNIKLMQSEAMIDQQQMTIDGFKDNLHNAKLDLDHNRGLYYKLKSELESTEAERKKTLEMYLEANQAAIEAESKLEQLHGAFTSLVEYYGKLLAYAPKELQEQFKENAKQAGVLDE